MRIGLANGCFDCFHSGHRFMLLEARSRCDYLIVAVNSDKSIKRIKGMDRPIDNYAYRLHKVSEFCDAAIPFDGFLGSLIVSIKPHILFVGYDHSTDTSMGNAQLAQGNGCAIVQLPELPGFSTTSIINETKFDAQTLQSSLP